MDTEQSVCCMQRRLMLWRPFVWEPKKTSSSSAALRKKTRQIRKSWPTPGLFDSNILSAQLTFYGCQGEKTCSAFRRTWTPCKLRWRKQTPPKKRAADLGKTPGGRKTVANWTNPCGFWWFLFMVGCGDETFGGPVCQLFTPGKNEWKRCLTVGISIYAGNWRLHCG